MCEDRFGGSGIGVEKDSEGWVESRWVVKTAVKRDQCQERNKNVEDPF